MSKPLIFFAYNLLSEGYVYSFAEVAIRIVILVLVSHGLIEVGRGHIRGIIYPILYDIFQAFQAIDSPVFEAKRQDLLFYVISLIGIALLNLIVASIYGFLRTRHN